MKVKKSFLSKRKNSKQYLSKLSQLYCRPETDFIETKNMSFSSLPSKVNNMDSAVTDAQNRGYFVYSSPA